MLILRDLNIFQSANVVRDHLIRKGSLNPKMSETTLKNYKKIAIFVSRIKYPALRTKETRLRVSILATHELWQLDHLVNSLCEIRKSLPF